MAAPILDGEQVTGVVDLESDRPQAFSAADLATLVDQDDAERARLLEAATDEGAVALLGFERRHPCNQILDHARELHRITGPLFIYGPPPTIRSFTRDSFRDGLTLAPWRTLDASIGRNAVFKGLHLVGRLLGMNGFDGGTAFVRDGE